MEAGGVKALINRRPRAPDRGTGVLFVCRFFVPVVLYFRSVLSPSCYDGVIIEYGMHFMSKRKCGNNGDDGNARTRTRTITGKLTVLFLWCRTDRSDRSRSR